MDKTILYQGYYHQDKGVTPDIVEREVVDVKYETSRQIYPEEVFYDTYRVKGEKYPYDFEIARNRNYCQDSGLATGFGDLLVWEYFASFDIEEVKQWQIKMNERYISNKNNNNEQLRTN